MGTMGQVTQLGIGATGSTQRMGGTVRESGIQKAIRKYLSLTGVGLFWRNNTGALPAIGVGGGRFPMRFGLGVGSPDIIGILRPNGRLFGLEIKSATGKLSKEQVAWHKAANEAGAYVAVARSVEDAERHLTLAMNESNRVE